jgi:uncharacterized protein YdbL (DUF1318 family)
MRKIVLFPCVTLAVLVAACVTINVYFPAAAAEKAADRIIGDVIGKAAGSSNEGKESPTGALDRREQRHDPSAGASLTLVAGLDRVLSALVPAAQAASPDLDVSSAAIRQITDAMKARHAQLAKYYDSGAIGYTANGLIDVRDANGIALAERNSVRKSVADENRDRSALYAEIAKANGHPEWEADIRATFAKRWVANAKPGWYYNDGSGWKQK